MLLSGTNCQTWRNLGRVPGLLVVFTPKTWKFLDIVWVEFLIFKKLLGNSLPFQVDIFSPEMWSLKYLFRYSLWFQPHSRPINCLTYDFFDNSKLVSTSFDGTVRIFDINEKVSSTLYARSEDKSSYTTYHVQIDRDCYLVTLGGPGTSTLTEWLQF